MVAIVLKRDFNKSVFLVNIAKFLRISILKNICERLLLYLQSKSYWLNVGHLPTLNQKHNKEWFLLRTFLGPLKIYYILVVNRNHSNRLKYYSKGYLFWYQDFDRFTQVVVHYLMSILMTCKINRWRNFKDKGHLFYIKPPDDS